eukprot:444668_1
MSHLFNLQILNHSNDYTIITATIITLIVSSVVTLQCCLRIRNNKHNKTITFNHNTITTKLINDTKTCSKLINDFISTNPKIIGLDCEWVRNHKVSLLQIANNNLIILIRLNQLKSIPIELISLLRNVQIIKCGVGIKGDMKKLLSDYNIETFGCIELNNLYKQITSNNNITENISLKNLYKLLMNKDMQYKHISITRSNWESQILSDKQCHYAADDALAGYQIFNKIMQIFEYDNIDYTQILYGLIDNFQTHKTHSNIKQNNISKLTHSNVLNNVGKKILFDNCKILQPDGSLLGFCSKCALQWHLNEGLAITVDKQTIKLKKTKPVKVQIFDEYIRTESPNVCFVCGNTNNNNLRKYSVFPLGYTRYINKDKYYDRSCFNHDNILLCLFCNKKAQKTEIEFKKLLCDKYKNVTHFEIPSKLWYAIKCAKTLRRYERRKQIPIYKQIKLLERVLIFIKVKYKIICVEALIVCGFLRINGIKTDGKTEIIFEQCLPFYYNEKDILMNRLIQLENEENDDVTLQKHIDKLADFNQKKQLQLHCKDLVAMFNDRQLEFIEMWRKHFVDNMKPRFLPNDW